MKLLSFLSIISLLFVNNVNSANTVSSYLHSTISDEIMNETHDSVYNSLFVDRLSYCKKEEIEKFDCADCHSNREMIGVFDPVSKASSQVVVTIDKEEEEILIGFRGTINKIQQWASDLDVKYTKWFNGNGKVHSGFYDRFNEIKTPTITFLKKAQKELPNGDIIISGHSMGAAVAVMFASYLKELNIHPRFVYTYGSPRVGDRAFAQYVDKQFGDQLIRIMNDWDMVTDLPPVAFGYRHTGKLVTCKTSTSECQEKGRMDENPGGVIMAIKRAIETAKNVDKCHLTYLGETIGTKRYKCV
jgi:predicted lipase